MTASAAPRRALTSLEEALDLLLAHAAARADAPRSIERVSLMDAAGRISAQRLTSVVDVPNVDCSQMDGYAVHAADLAAAEPSSMVALPVVQRIAAGRAPVALPAGAVARVFTGAPLPAGADAVIMQEHVQREGDRAIFAAPTVRGCFVRRSGSDLRQGETVLEAGHVIDAVTLGLLASAGISHVEVAPKLRVAVFFTGDELAMPGQALPPGGVYNANRYVLRALLTSLGCEVTDLGEVPDTLDATREALQRAALDHDVIVSSGGMSVGEEDHVRPAVASLGTLSMWQIALKPGKPLAYGTLRRRDDTPAHFVGLPGNPVSAFVTYVLLVRPFLRRLQGVSEAVARHLPRMQLKADFAWDKPDTRREYLRAKRQSDGTVALYPSQMASTLASVVWADGLVENPPGQAVAPGDAVCFIPLGELGL